MKTGLRIAVFFMFVLIATLDNDALACTRVVYHNNGGMTVTGRTLDWKTPIPTNLYVMPREARRKGSDDENTVKWVSKYGSVVNVGYDMGTSEGINEKGLVVNLLYLPGTVYSLPGDMRPAMSVSVWAQYVLDNFATVDEAVTELKKDTFRIEAPAMPGGESTTLHMAISDPSGNNAILEYVDAKLQIHEGKEYNVLTNRPIYDQQLAIREYWEGIGGMNMLPGTNRASDRFVRGSFYVGILSKELDDAKALAGVFGVMRNVSVPMGITTPDQPEISSTQWLSVADQKNLVYYFGLTLSPSILWVDLKKIDFSKHSGTQKLTLADGEYYEGLANDKFVKVPEFRFVYSIPADLMGH